ncbi:DUF488 family protein [Jatrophihabitans sp.]|uniref:DUF488 family protein, N3 subclade n=1 Tax=Jatrophihabitans sp. TaxID=1932789 RepID=UPI0038CDC68B
MRLTPLSRKPGLSKRKLTQTLEGVGIRYLHLRALGNPKDNRDKFRAGDPRSHATFKQLMAGSEGAAALRHVGALLDDEVVALLCFERDHHTCHRHLVAAELQRTQPTLGLIEI